MKAYETKREQLLRRYSSNAAKYEFTNLNIVIYTYEYNTEVGNGYVAFGFSGRKSKPEWKLSFKTPEARQQHIFNYLYRKEIALEESNKRKQEEKLRKETLFKTIKVGDVFHEGGGYEQTNCYFYELIELKGKTGTFRQIAGEIVPGSEGFMSCRRKPVPGEYIGDKFKARINGNMFKTNSYNFAIKCDKDATFYNSWYA